MSSKFDIDYQDSKKMWEFQMESLEKAEAYAECRMRYAQALKTLKLGLIHAYKQNIILKKYSEDKAYLMLADLSEAFKQALMDLIEFQNRYKGYEKILEAREGARSFNQSLIKNQPK